MGLAFTTAVAHQLNASQSVGSVSLRHRMLHAAVATAVLVTASVAVGLTSPADSPLSITIHPVFLRLETSPCGQPRPRILAVDVEMKIGTLHAHAGWPGFTFAAQ